MEELMVTTKNPNGQPNNVDPQVEELMVTVRLLQTQNADQRQQNHEQLIASLPDPRSTRDAITAIADKHEKVYTGIGGH